MCVEFMKNFSLSYYLSIFRRWLNLNYLWNNGCVLITLPYSDCEGIGHGIGIAHIWLWWVGKVWTLLHNMIHDMTWWWLYPLKSESGVGSVSVKNNNTWWSILIYIHPCAREFKFVLYCLLQPKKVTSLYVCALRHKAFTPITTRVVILVK